MFAAFRINVLLMLLLLNVTGGEAQRSISQVSISRIEQMPRLPDSYKLKDWKTVARNFDRLAFDFKASGPYLPLIWWDDTRPNVDRRTFGLPSYVGHPTMKAGSDHEAITCLGAVLGATLAGIDKSHDRYNWVAMLEQYCNKSTGSNLVLNRSRTATGQSFWYELFPQVLIACIADRYPKEAGLQRVVRLGADRWYEACVALGGPRGTLNFDHTSFDFSTMRPVDNGKWKEPDAAAAVAWLEYMAYRKFGERRYLQAADWCLTWLEQRAENPLYELLLPFGALTAARMNAEQGCRYNVEKLVNWCFTEGSKARPGWGMIVGRWGGYDCSGLMGSVTDGGGYAFAMNTFVSAGVLTPLVRYDPHFARSLGRWMVNAASAARLFYPDELPASQQSGSDWSGDPAHGMAYEGLRREWKGVSPRAMGDPSVQGWAATDFGLYGSAYAGMFAGLIAPTNIPGVLRLDLRATDFYRTPGPPVYLYYNPYPVTKRIRIEAGRGWNSLFDRLHGRTLGKPFRGVSSFLLPSDTAVVIEVRPETGPGRSHPSKRTSSTHNITS